MAGNMMHDVKRILASLTSAPDFGEDPPTVGAALAMTERYRLSELLPFRGWDPSLDMVAMDDNEQMSMGFGFEIAPAIYAGTSLEEQLESILTKLPPDSVMQVGMLFNDDVYAHIDRWEEARLRNNTKYPLLAEMSKRRAAFLRECSKKRSLLPSDRMHTRFARCLMFFRIPYHGDHSSPQDVNNWIKMLIDQRATINDALASNQFHPRILKGVDHKRIMVQMLNPQFEIETLDKSYLDYRRFPKGLLMKEGRIRKDPKSGVIQFTGGERDCAAVVITADGYPEEVALPTTRALLGDIFSRTDLIPDRYWAWMVAHTPDRDDARSEQQLKLANITRMTLSESQWFRSMAGDLYRRKDETDSILKDTQQRRSLVRATVGIVVYCDLDKVPRTIENVTSIWRRAGFEASPEKHVALPMFMSALPYGYNYRLDNKSKGLQRLELMTSFQAACLMPVAFDWRGHDMGCGGPTMISRRGQIGSLDFLRSETNYNATVVAQSGSGKSFFTAELVADFLSRGGFVRMIDAGRSYAPLAEIIGGENIEFNIRNPKSLNPLYDIPDLDTLKEKMASLKEILTLMAFSNGNADDWAKSEIERAITVCWQEQRKTLELRHIEEYLRAPRDNDRPESIQRRLDIADQLQTYSTGNLSKWFNGPREVDITNDFTILELDGLNSNKPLRAVVLTLIINSILDDMYLREKREIEAAASGATVKLRPKLLGVDEAWDLMGAQSGGAGRFIEEAARRIRKYNGVLCTITQSYQDYDASDSARAALTNSAWRIALAQSGSSLEFAKRGGPYGTGSEMLWRLLETVRRGNGYSEMHISNSGFGDVMRFIIDPFSYYTYSTAPQDKNAIAELRGNGKTLIEAIAHLADKSDFNARQSIS